mmetsp:Transcript_17174/g.29117  ORF Transcript_17174/g.29117 Transcript_17174/m.29117 type:complete len:80 (+) Transcript_17174:706-945(+)
MRSDLGLLPAPHSTTSSFLSQSGSLHHDTVAPTIYCEMLTTQQLNQQSLPHSIPSIFSFTMTLQTLYPSLFKWSSSESK